MKIPNRFTQALIVILLAAGFGGVWFSLGRHEPINVILITLDTTRADRLQTYGYHEGLTSELDAFARQGVVFDRAYSPAPITLPSHATMLTGLYPPEHGLRVNGQGKLAREIPFLPEILKNHGYKTAAFVSAAVLDAMFGLNRGFDLYEDFASQRKKKRLTRQRRPGQDVVDSALTWLQASATMKKPFFCWIHLFDAHAPYEPRPELFGAKFEDNPYDSGIAFELQQVERVVSLLKELHLQEKTLVIIAADHGEGLKEHRESEHGMLAYDSTLRVPLVLVGTRYCQPQTRVRTVVSLADITPTVLDILNLPQVTHVSGRSLKAALSGGAIPSKPCYAEAESPLVFNRWCPLHVLISEDWKYIDSKQPELYDLKTDPGETRNLFQEGSDQANEFSARLEDLEKSFVTFKPQNVKLNDKQIADLNALGYVGVKSSVTDTKSIDPKQLSDVKEMLFAIERLDEAKALSLRGNVDAAIGMLRELIQDKRCRDYLEPAYLLGDCLTAANRPEEAVEVYLGILETHPEIEHTHFRMATALLKMGNLEQAEKAFRRTILHDPDSAIARCELARVLNRMGRTDDAILAYHDALRIEPDNPSTNVELGQLLLKARRPREAISCFELAVKLNPLDGVPQATLLGLYVQFGETTRAIELARNSVNLDPNSFEARYNLAVLLTSLKRIDEGLREFREARKLRPDEPRVLEQINRIEAAMNRPGK